MLRSLISKKFASTFTQGPTGATIPRRATKKIKLGKARPAIYYQFDVMVELSDGSVVKRKSQFPKNELRLIQDQRNNPLWNPTKDDLVVVDANAGGSMDKFKQKYNSMFTVEKEEAKAAETPAKSDSTIKQTAEKKKAEEVSKKDLQEDAFGLDDYLSILDDETAQIKTGNLATKKKTKK